MKSLVAIFVALLMIAGCSSSDSDPAADGDDATEVAGDEAETDTTTDTVEVDDESSEPEPSPTPEFTFDPDALPPGADAAAVAGFIQQFGIDQQTAQCVVDEIGIDDPENIDFERFADLNEEICGMTVGQLLGVTPR